MTEEYKLAKAARWYAEKMGWEILPLAYIKDSKCACGSENCKSPGKHPLCNGGFYSATNDIGQVRRWWAKWPKANIGLRTGDLIVLDVDAPDGEPLLDRLFGDVYPPPTLEATTRGQNGGRHLYFQSDGAKLPTRPIYKGEKAFTCKGQKGYVVIPPSIGVKGEYECKTPPHKAEIAPVPKVVIDTVERRTEEPAQPKESIIVRDEKVPDGNRHDFLTSYAVYLRKSGFTEEEILALVKIANKTRCATPKEDESELIRIAQWADKEVQQGQHPFQTEGPSSLPRPCPISDILALEIKEIPYIVERLIPRAEPFGIFGPGESFKTWVGWELTRCMVRGETFLGRFDISEPGPVLWLDGESGSKRICIRANLMGIESDMPVYTLTDGKAQGLYLDSPTFPLHFGKILEEAKIRPQLVLIDSVTRFFQGNENASAEVARAQNNLWEIAREHDCSPVIFHHTRKFSQNDRTENRYKIRGSVDWTNAISSGIYIERQKDGALMVEPAKTRDHLPFERFGLRLESSMIHPGRLTFRDAEVKQKPPTKVEIAMAFIKDEIRRAGPIYQSTLIKKNPSIGG